MRACVDSPWRVFGAKPIIGEVAPAYASLRRRVRWRSLFRACLDVSLLDDSCTLLICRPGLHPLAALLAGGWLGLLIAIGGLIGVFALAGGVLEGDWLLVALPALLFVGLMLAFLFGRGDPACDHAFLIERLALMTESTAN